MVCSLLIMWLLTFAWPFFFFFWKLVTMWNFLSTRSNGHKASLTLSLNFNTNSCTPENVGRLITPAKKLEDTIRLAELVIEVLQQNEEHHAEVSGRGGKGLSVFTSSGCRPDSAGDLPITCSERPWSFNGPGKDGVRGRWPGHSPRTVVYNQPEVVTCCAVQIKRSGISSDQQKRWVYWEYCLSSV